MPFGSSSHLVIQLHRSKIAISERMVADWNILMNQGRNEHSLHDWLSHQSSPQHPGSSSLLVHQDRSAPGRGAPIAAEPHTSIRLSGLIFVPRSG
jgi:hypothetical protein